MQIEYFKTLLFFTITTACLITGCGRYKPDNLGLFSHAATVIRNDSVFENSLINGKISLYGKDKIEEYFGKAMADSLAKEDYSDYISEFKDGIILFQSAGKGIFVFTSTNVLINIRNEAQDQDSLKNDIDGLDKVEKIDKNWYVGKRNTSIAR